MDRIITFFRPPVFDDEDKTFSTGLLYTCLNFEWPFLVLYCLYVLTNRQNPLRFLVGLVFLVLIFSLMAATRRGHIKAVSVIFVSICYTLLTLMTFFLSHGVEDTAYIAGTFSLLIIIGLILSWKFLSVFTGVVVFTTLAMAFAEAAGLKPLPIGPRDEITAALILSFISIQSAFLLGFSAYKLQSALNQYRKVLSERKRAEMEVQRQADNLEAVNRLSIELAQTGLDDDIYALITGRMRETFNALAVTVSIFDSALTSMVLKQISIREGMVAMAYQLFERRLEHMTMWVNPQQLDTMKTTHITRLASISELTFGAIPETLSQTAGVLFGIKEIYVCILQHHEELIGSMAIILGEDSEIFDEITVEAMLQVFSIAIRRRLAEENLRLSEDRFRSIALKGYDVIIVINLEGIITYESPSASRILGMQPGSLSGQSVYSLIHPDDVSEAQLKIEKTARLGEEDVSGMPHEYRIRHARGEWVYFEAIALNLLKRPSVKGIVITAHDIGERKRADLEIQALNASLEQRVTERTNSLNQVNRDLEAFTGFL